MKKKKTMSGKRLFLAVILAFIMAMQVPVTAFALNEASITEAEATDLSDALDYDWKVSTEGSVLTVVARDARADITDVGKWNGALYLGATMKARQAFSGTTCTMTYDFSGTEDGEKTLRLLVFVEGTTTDTTMWYRDIFIKISGEQVSIYNPYGQSSVDFLTKMNEERDPKAYCNPASIMMMNAAGTSYEDIVALAKDVTKGKTTAAEKVLAIHDWICKNCAYDQNKASSLRPVQDMYQNRYGVCDHFAQLTTFMCRAAGVPCITIEGYGDSCLEEGDDQKTLNHAWNAVYYNNSWHFIDNTWDCANRYYGEGNSKNTIDKAPGYKYFDLPAAVFGASHYGKIITADAAVPKGIVVKNGPTTYLVGQPFSTEYDVYYEQYGGDTSFLAAEYEQAEFSGFDSSKEGEQTITVKFHDYTTQFTVNVYQKAGIKAVPKEDVIYKKGENFVPEYTLYYTTSAEGVTVPVEDVSEATITGYDINQTGEQTVTVTYDGFTTTFEINVVDNEEEVVIDYDRIAANPISGYTYLRGENFTPQYKLYGIKNSTQEEITDLSNVKLTFDNTKIRPTVTVQYGELTTTFDIATINPTGIVYTTSSVKFNVADEFKVEGVLKYTTSTGNKEVRDPEPGEITFSGYDMSKAGKQTVTVTYKVYSKTYTTTFDITVLGLTASEDEKKEETTEATTEETKKETKTPVVSNVSLAKTSYTYTGKVFKPAVTVVDADGKKLGSSDYSVTYSNNKNVGTAKATITFKGDYAKNAKIVQSFIINPKGTTISKVTAKSKKLVVKIKAQKTQTTGYQIRYSLKKNMSGAKTVTIKNNRTSSATISKLNAKKKYYVQVRTYKTVSGKTYYSGWSKTVAKATLK